jgi:uncharacterized repeat protein (TIGR03803 family)
MGATLKVLYSFTGGADGAFPRGTVEDRNGNFYGETGIGGTTSGPCGGCGTVFKLSPAGVLTNLVTFNGRNGSQPNSPLTLVGDTLYGTTEFGGIGSRGVIFSVRTDGSDFRLLHVLQGIDGATPVGNLAVGLRGELYGVTDNGGLYHHGTLYEIAKGGSFTVLHHFLGTTDGAAPTSLEVNPLTGAVFGGTAGGGDATCPGMNGFVGCGLVYEYEPRQGLFTVLHNFETSEGAQPTLGSIGPDGTLYGTAFFGGLYGAGTIFSLATGAGAPGPKVLWSFNPDQGYWPAGGPTLGADGSLTGTTEGGGPYGGGTLYRYSGGSFSTLANFGAPVSDGYDPSGQMALLRSGGVVGAASTGGIVPCIVDGGMTDGCGTIYKYSP